MKKQQALYLILFFSILIGLVSISSCNKKNTLSQQDQVKAILTSSTWKIQSVTVSGVDQTSVYQNLTLTFTTTNYTATNGLPVWPTNGTWTFTDETATAFTRDDGVEVTILEATNTSLRLGLAWNKTTLGGRVSSVAGQYAFSFIKQ